MYMYMYMYVSLYYLRVPESPLLCFVFILPPVTDEEREHMECSRFNLLEGC